MFDFTLTTWSLALLHGLNNGFVLNVESFNIGKRGRQCRRTYSMGNVGKSFVAELSRLCNAFPSGSALESIALMAAIVLPILVLQSPHRRSRVKTPARWIQVHINNQLCGISHIKQPYLTFLPCLVANKLQPSTTQLTLHARQNAHQHALAMHSSSRCE